jgi:3-methyladenine DNA glycosylase/8-oxoguanine DNA glycosylase
MKFKKYFKFKHVSNEQVDSLISIEEKLQPYIDKFKPFNIRIMPNFFYCLVHTIISQQLSNKAVDSI